MTQVGDLKFFAPHCFGETGFISKGVSREKSIFPRGQIFFGIVVSICSLSKTKSAITIFDLSENLLIEFQLISAMRYAHNNNKNIVGCGCSYCIDLYTNVCCKIFY
jgi:hypothetical protein